MSNDGKDLELLVQLIEKSIDPDATVEHNVLLPVLTSTQNRTRQCDIVIRQGKSPRETLTIVEVQDRNSAVDINTFGGWIKKLKDVGAQHLICVSRQDFPDSIKEEVMQSGNTVRLITLKEMPQNSLPTTFGIEINHVHFNIISLEINAINNSFDVSKDKQTIKEEDILFSLNKDTSQLLALKHICSKSLSKVDLKEITGEKAIRIDHTEEDNFYLYLNNTFIPVQFKVHFAWSLKHENISMNILSYEQDTYGAMVWIAYTPKNIPPVRMIIKEYDGIYYLQGMLIGKEFLEKTNLI